MLNLGGKHSFLPLDGSGGFFLSGGRRSTGKRLRWFPTARWPWRLTLQWDILGSFDWGESARSNDNVQCAYECRGQLFVWAVLSSRQLGEGCATPSPEATRPRLEHHRVVTTSGWDGWTQYAAASDRLCISIKKKKKKILLRVPCLLVTHEMCEIYCTFTVQSSPAWVS